MNKSEREKRKISRRMKEGKNVGKRGVYRGEKEKDEGNVMKGGSGRNKIHLNEK